MDDRISRLERALAFYRKLVLLCAGVVLVGVTAAFVLPLVQDPEAFKITTPNASSSPTTRIQVSGNENTAQIGMVNSNVGFGTSTQFGSGVGVVALANATTNPSTNPSGGGVMYAESGQLKWRRSDGTIDVMGSVSSGPSLDVAVCEGRLTLTSATAITTTDVTAATTVYFTPFRGNRIALYGGSSWTKYSFSERSLSLSGLAASTNFDIYIYDNAGTLTLESLAWTNDTTRATALTTQDGIYVKSGATTRRYLGTIRTTATTGQCEDSLEKRFVWNYYNRCERKLLRKDPNSWWYGTNGSWRQYGNSSSNRVNFVIGVNEDPVLFHFKALNSTSSGYTNSLGLDLDGTTTNDADEQGDCASVYYVECMCRFYKHVSEGFHYLQMMEYGGSAGTIIWFGTPYSAGLGHIKG